MSSSHGDENSSQVIIIRVANNMTTTTSTSSSDDAKQTLGKQYIWTSEAIAALVEAMKNEKVNGNFTDNVFTNRKVGNLLRSI